jgi:hypothetical protein
MFVARRTAGRLGIRGQDRAHERTGEEASEQALASAEQVIVHLDAANVFQWDGIGRLVGLQDQRRPWTGRTNVASLDGADERGLARRSVFDPGAVTLERALDFRHRFGREGARQLLVKRAATAGSDERHKGRERNEAHATTISKPHGSPYNPIQAVAAKGWPHSRGDDTALAAARKESAWKQNARFEAFD